MSEAVLLAAGAATGYGVADFLGGFFGRKLDILSVLLVSHVAGLAALAAVMAALGRAEPVPADLAWGAAAGVGSAMGGYCLLRGFAVGRMSVVSTVAALTAAGLPLGADLALGARLDAASWAGVLLGLVAIGLVSTGDADRVNGRRGPAAGTTFGVLSGVGYASMYLALDQAGPDSGLWPALMREAFFVLIVGLAAAATRWRPYVPRGALVGVSGIGVAAGLATASFLLAARLGAVGIAAVIASLSPAVTVLLARILLGETVTRQQVVGLIGAGLALVLIGGE